MVNSNIISIVQGLRQTTANMASLVDGKTDRGDIGNESHGFTLEAITQYADRIDGFATELASAVGYVEPSADLLAAREIVVRVLGLHVANAVRQGAWDEQNITKHVLAAITKGRELADADAQKQRITDAVAAPSLDPNWLRGYLLNAKPSDLPVELTKAFWEGESARRQFATATPDRLTITIDGPQGSGKTLTGDWLRRNFPSDVRLAYSSESTPMRPLIIEMRDGRRFDVRNEVFLDGTEG